MNDKCYEPGTIQAFLDGETSPQLSFEITNHAAVCETCALRIAEAEEETAQVFAMLDREMNTLVPTQRLWSSISVAIAEEKSHASVWDKLRSYALALFANPSLAVAAGVLIVFGIFAGVWTVKEPATNDLAGNQQVTVPQTNAPTAIGISEQPSQPNFATEPKATQPDDRVFVKETNHSPEKIRKMVTMAVDRSSDLKPSAVKAVVSEEYLPGEESYVRTIADLRQSVEGRKDVILDPSTRISFERDMAVVNDAIKRMKAVVKKNPKNQAAKQVLYSSYQNKIDLLNSVVERGELMASMQ